MNEMLDQAVFTVGERSYCWQDVMVAAKLWGDWADLETTTRQGASCLKKMGNVEDALPRGAVESAANEFRYAHSLITAQETQSWLALWGLSIEEWMGYFRRRLLREKLADRMPEIVLECTVTDDQASELFKIDAICSGQLTEWAKKLAGRAAVCEKVREESTERFALLDKEAEAIINAVTPEVKDKGLPGLAPEAFNDALESLARLEAAHNHFCEGVVTAKAIKDRIASHYLDWIRFDCSSVTFTDELMAKEAALCVREDGLELAEVAQDSKRPLSHAVMYLDQVELALKEHLLAAQKGSLIGPVKLGDQYTLFWLIDKQMPSGDDSEIRERAKQSLLKSAINHEINNRVRWIARL